MKKFFLAWPLLALGVIATLTFCSKEIPDTQTVSVVPETGAAGDLEVYDRDGEDPSDPEGCNPTFWVRIDYQPLELSESNTYQILEDGFTIRWSAASRSWECGPSTIVPGVWYPVTIWENRQYQFTYTYRQRCNKPAPEVCLFSIRSSGGAIRQYAAQSDYPIEFYRSGCATFLGKLP